VGVEERVRAVMFRTKKEHLTTHAVPKFTIRALRDSNFSAAERRRFCALLPASRPLPEARAYARRL
jgi:hypothetical protein